MRGLTPVVIPGAKDDQSLSDESSDVESVNHQIELEKDNEIQFRTCSWQKVEACPSSNNVFSYRSCLDSSITFF